MRALFWILLLGNVILFAVMQRGGLTWGEQAYQPQPPLHQEKIRLLAANQSAPAKALPVPAAPMAAPASAPAAAPLPAPLQIAASAPVANLAPAAKPAPLAARQNALVCLEWGDFSGADLKRATEVLSGLQLGDKFGQRQIEYTKGYWVYIPPLKSKTAANRRVAQIKKLGIREYFVVQEAGALRYAISLGVFKTREAAQNYLNELKAKGLRSAKVGERASKLKTTMLMVNNVDASIEGKLTAARQDFPGSELRNVPCALTR